MDIYIARGEERKGPYTAERIWQMLADGKLDGTELACHEGMDEWVNVRLAADETHTDCFIGFVFGGVQDGAGE